MRLTSPGVQLEPPPVGRQLVSDLTKRFLLMFPSSGLFADIICPFSKSGLCERPHCLYKHATEEVRDMCAASYKSSIVDFAGQCFEDCYLTIICRLQ